MSEDQCSVCKRVTLAVGRPPLLLEACPVCGHTVCQDCRVPIDQPGWDDYEWVCKDHLPAGFGDPDWPEPEPERSYPPPGQNPECKCWPNPMAAFFCMTGHLTECHWPMSCEEAECAHYLVYEE